MNSTTPLAVTKTLSWKMRLAIAVFWLPLMSFFVAILFQWPLPTFPGLNVSGDRAPEYIIFMAYQPENIKGSLVFSLIASALGFFCMVMVGLRECGYTLQHDVANFLDSFGSREANTHPSQNQSS